jgi:hypothetical protein
MYPGGGGGYEYECRACGEGVVAVGESIAAAMFRLWYVTKAAEIQVR